jgi:hypothetical protein
MKCHEPMMHEMDRTAGDTNLGCCKHVASAAPQVLTNLAIPRSSANATNPVPIVSSIRKRYVATQNIIVGGLLIHQTRAKFDECKGKLGSIAGNECSEATDVSTDAFGVDPVFISTSSLYDAQVQNLVCCRSDVAGQFAQGNAANSTLTAGAEMDDTDGAKEGAFYARSELNKQGTPFGFFSQSLDGRVDGFAVLVDINLREAAFSRVMAYLEEGFFLDQYTKTLSVELLTYNGQHRYLCALVVTFTFTEGGQIEIDYSTNTADVQPYFYDRNDKGAERMFNLRVGMEAFFVLLVFLMLLVEVMELVQCVVATGSVTGYFASLWNYIDLTSIALLSVCIAFWGLMLTRFVTFTTLHRYDVYLDNSQAARLLEMGQGGSPLRAFVDMVNDFNTIVNMQVLYVTFHGVNIFLCLLRFLKHCDFQPRMGVVTRTLSRAFLDLVHFFALVAIVLGIYTFLGQIVFGSHVQQFSTLAQASRTVISWSLAGDDRGVGDALFELPGQLATAGVLYYITFAVIMLLMLLNFLIAIISDSYPTLNPKS